MLTSPDIVPKILDCLDWPSKRQAACVCRQWRLLAGSAEASFSAGKCWLIWQHLWPPKGPVLRYVQKCKLALCTDRLHAGDFNWPQLPALTAVHLEARLTTTWGVDCPISWNSDTVRDLSVTVLRSTGHCLAHGDEPYHHQLELDVESSCLETLCVRAVMAETGLLACRGHDPTRFGHEPLGSCLDLGLDSVPALRQLLVCCQEARVGKYQTDASQPGDRPTVSFSGLKAAFLTGDFGVQLNSGDYGYGDGFHYAKVQDMFQLCEALDADQLKGSLQLASDSHTMQLLQIFFESGCCPHM